MALSIWVEARNSCFGVQFSGGRLWATFTRLCKNWSAQIGSHREYFRPSWYLSWFGSIKKGQYSGFYIISHLLSRLFIFLGLGTEELIKCEQYDFTRYEAFYTKTILVQKTWVWLLWLWNGVRIWILASIKI